ncbi:hypothetical protein CGZ69_20525 [Streptomyces peucetius subsp. caesius ATCC 27952]|nr:hypothetical protein CGZ69_20525 [Streptomyces peucetius subsp. caesius ATCC 27952]
MTDTRPAATELGCCAFSRTVHIVRLDLCPPPSGAGSPRRSGAPRPSWASSPRRGSIKRPGDVIFPSTAAHTLRARLNASCSLVSLAVQSLRSM